MNPVDVVIVVVFALAGIVGFRQGFVLEIAGVFGSVIALGVARLEYGDVRSNLEHIASRSPWLTIIAYLIVFLFIWGAVIILARKIRTLLRLMMLGWLDRVVGAIFGFAQAAVVIELLLYFSRRAPNSGIRHVANHSALAPAFLSVMPLLNHVVPHVPR